METAFSTAVDVLRFESLPLPLPLLLPVPLPVPRPLPLPLSLRLPLPLPLPVPLPLLPPLFRNGEIGGDLMDWAGLTRLTPNRQHCLPASEAEVMEQLAIPGPVRLVGSRLSHAGLLQPRDTDDVLMDIQRMRGLRSVAAESVTFKAGTTLNEVHRTLTEMGRMLPCSPGVIGLQTLAGALATGTHGQGLGQSTISDTVLSMRFVDGSGGLHEVSRSHPWFGAIQLGLGCFGVLTEVALQTIGARTFTCHKRTIDADSLPDDLVKWAESFEMCKVWWFPEARLVHRWTAGEATVRERAAYCSAGSNLTTVSRADSSLNSAVDANLSKLSVDTKDGLQEGRQFETLKRFKNHVDVTGDIYQIFCNGIPAPQVNLEIAVPLRRAAEAIRVLDAWIAATHQHLHYPVILRVTGPSTAWLSPAQSQPVCWFGFVAYYAKDGSVSPEALAFLLRAQELLAAMEGRPHWGKHYNPLLYKWPALYPHWLDFCALRAQLDPQARFSNRHTDDMFVPPFG
jgi:FAD/FMN-containing dehydrogenase